MRINVLLLSLLHVTFGIFAQEGDNVYSDYGVEEEPPGLEWIKRDDSKYEYHFHTELKDFDGAQSFCGAEDAYLVSIKSQEENDWLMDTRITSQQQWIGLTNYGGGKFMWFWTDRSDTKYTNWRKGGGKDESKQKGEDCATFAGEGRGESRWFSERCSVPRAFICKREISPCKPNPCGEDRECRVDGKSYECICHHCDSGVATFVSAWTGNTVLLVFGIILILIVTLVVLVIIGSCVRGCFEQHYSPARVAKNERSKNGGGRTKGQSSPEEVCLTMEKELIEENHYVPSPKPSPKPPIPPNKPRWTREKKDPPSPSLSDSARGRSPPSVDSDEDGTISRKCSIQIHDETST